MTTVKDKKKFSDYIEPTKQYAEDIKIASEKIDKEIDNILLDLKTFENALSEIKEKHREGMNMQQISDSYQKEKEQKEIKGIEDDILDIFSKKLKSLKQSLKISSEEDFI